MKRGSGERCNIRPPPDGGVEHDYDENNHGKRHNVWGQMSEPSKVYSFRLKAEKF